MQNDAQRLSINLGRKDTDSTSSIFIKWTINTGRIIIVGVELLTLAALGYRFIIDRQIVDLNDQIRKSQIFVEAQAINEKKYRNLQERLTTIKTIEMNTKKKVVFLSELVSYLNTSEFLTSNLNVSDTNIAIDGQTYSIFTLNTLIDKLKKNPSVLSISIEELTSLDQGIRFKLVTTLQQTDISL